MSLLARVTSDLGCDEEQALRGLGPLFMLLKLAIPTEIHAQILEAVPEATSWAHLAARGDAGRTGEVLTLLTPDTIQDRIVRTGFSQEAAIALGQSVGDYLRCNVGPEVADRVGAIVPLVQGPVPQSR